MSKLTKVVLADDSPFVCSMLKNYLQSTTEFEILGVAYDGLEALDLVKQTRPDVLTLDLEMPKMNGLEVIEHVMYECPTPIVVISGISRNASDITLKALEMGAVDFILKYTPGIEINPEYLQADIISKVKGASNIRVIRSLKSHEHYKANKDTKLYPFFDYAPIKKAPAGISYHSTQDNIIEAGVLVVGASTGGPVALKELINHLPDNYPQAIVVVQHMNSSFTRVLASQLNKNTNFRVKEAEDGDMLMKDLILIAPGDYHLMIGSDLRVKLTKGPKVKGHRPSIDVTMQSVSQVYGSKTKGVVLTGMGDDGAMGLLAIKSKWGSTYVQEPSDCVVDSMPKSAIKKGVVDYIEPCWKIASLLGSNISKGSMKSASSKSVRKKQNILKYPNW
ncbi:MAG TPA: chemotaxis-specific protein-glutamate methyltransferase CheB [Thermodesulfobacteriota bacterium]|nr:chemotaxis-specific protein-glutamate methyltransferase CheB [Thermodesulfobacteriota bacterium]